LSKVAHFMVPRKLEREGEREREKGEREIVGVRDTF
jgi:hypothetical protein